MALLRKKIFMVLSFLSLSPQGWALIPGQQPAQQMEAIKSATKIATQTMNAHQREEDFLKMKKKKPSFQTLSSGQGTPAKGWEVIRRTGSHLGHKTQELIHNTKGSVLLRHTPQGTVFDYFEKTKGIVKGYIKPDGTLKFSRSSRFFSKTKDQVRDIKETILEAHGHSSKALSSLTRIPAVQKQTMTSFKEKAQESMKTTFQKTKVVTNEMLYGHRSKLIPFHSTKISPSSLPNPFALKKETPSRPVAKDVSVDPTKTQTSLLKKTGIQSVRAQTSREALENSPAKLSLSRAFSKIQQKVKALPVPSVRVKEPLIHTPRK